MRSYICVCVYAYYNNIIYAIVAIHQLSRAPRRKAWLKYYYCYETRSRFSPVDVSSIVVPVRIIIIIKYKYICVCVNRFRCWLAIAQSDLSFIYDSASFPRCRPNGRFEKLIPNRSPGSQCAVKYVIDVPADTHVYRRFEILKLELYLRMGRVCFWKVFFSRAIDGGNNSINIM